MKHDALIAPDESQFAFTPKISGFAANDGSTDTITVPDAELLFQGTFKRDGDDLKIFGKDGNAFLVDDYFKHDKKPALLSPEGASLSSAVVESLAGPLAAGQYAQAGAPQSANQAIGRVEKAEGSVSVVRNGVTITLNAGDVVMKGDVVQTGSGGSLGIVFSDGTAFNLAANARMILNDFVYNAGGGGNSALISLVQGSISFVAGQVAKTGDMKVETPVATMGIRGTAVLVEIDANNGQTKFSVMVEPNGTTGSFNLYDKSSGALLATVNNSAIGWVVSPAGPLQVIAQQVQKTPAELARELAIVQQVFQTFNTGPFDPNAPQQPPQQQDPQRRGDNPQGTQTAGSGSSGGVNIEPIKVSGTQTPTGNNQTNNNQNDNTNDDDNTGNDDTGIGDDPPAGGETETTTITANNIYGTNDNDTIEGTPINDFVFAGAGDDTIIAGHGGGNDFYDGDGDGGKTPAFAGEGYDTIKFESADGVTFDLFGIEELNKASSASTGLDDFTNIERIVASPGDDVFNLHAGAWHIEAGEGNDVFNLYGAFHSDLDGGAGIDTIFFVGDLDITEDTEGPDVASIEVIDLNTTGSNTVDLDIEGVLEMLEGSETGYLTIEGTSADQVNLSNEDHNQGQGYQDGDWRLADQSDELPEFEGYTLYVFDNDGEIEAKVYIRDNITTEVAPESVPPTVTVSPIEEILQEDEGGSAQALVTVSDPDSDVRYVLNESWTPVLPEIDGVQVQEFDGHYYAYVPLSNNETWTQAYNAALQMGGYLATVTSGEENEFILNEVINGGIVNQVSAAFIGGSDAGSEGLWYWSSGLEGIPYFWSTQGNTSSYGQYTNWRTATGEPNGGSNENHLAMEGDGTWNDVADNHAYAVGYVVEFSSFRMQGEYGYAVFNTANGSITYHLNTNDADTQALGENEQVYDSFMISVSDGDSTVTEPVYFAIEGANDAPVVDSHDAEVDYTVGDPGVVVNSDITLSDIDSDTLAGAKITISNFVVGDNLIFANAGNITGSFDPETGVLTLTGEDSIGNYQFALRSISYQNIDPEALAGDRTITFEVDDGAENKHASNVAASTIHVEDDGGEEIPNQAPVINIDSVITTDDPNSTTVLGLEVFDADGSPGDIYTVTASALVGTLSESQGNRASEIEFSVAFEGLNNKLAGGITYFDPNEPEPGGGTVNDRVTLTVTDANGASDTINFIFNLFNDGESGIILSGTGGKDILFATGYDDTLTGDPETRPELGSADVFVFEFDEFPIGNDTITDFDLSEDRMVFDGGDFSSFEQLLEANAISYADGKATIDLGEDGAIVLNNIAQDALKASNFVFHPDLA